MLTKNYYKLIAGCGLPSPNNTVEMVNYTGESYAYSVSYNDSVRNKVAKALGFNEITTVHNALSGSSTNGVLFGTGTEEPTIDDFFLSGDIVGGIATNFSVSFDSDESGSTKTATITVTNTNGTDITIGEIAYLAYFGLGRSVMIDRTLLESPITIPAGGVGHITYTIKMNYPVG